MISLMAAVTFSVCTNCVGVGTVEMTCPDCNGSGLFVRHNVNRERYIYHDRVQACKKCARGMIKPGDKGSGKVRRLCPVCKGLKKIKAVASKSEL